MRSLLSGGGKVGIPTPLGGGHSHQHWKRPSWPVPVAGAHVDREANTIFLADGESQEAGLCFAGKNNRPATQAFIQQVDQQPTAGESDNIPRVSRLSAPRHACVLFKGPIMHLFEQSLVGPFPHGQHSKRVFGSLVVNSTCRHLVELGKVAFDQVCHSEH